MKFPELMDLAGKEPWGTEVIGQLWIERKKILLRINKRPPQCRLKEAQRQLRLLWGRMEKAKKGPAFTVGDDGFDQFYDRIVRKW